MSMTQEEQQAYDEALEKLQEQDRLLKQLTALPLGYGVVLSTDGPEVMVSSPGGGITALEHPMTATKAGAGVLLSMQTGQIVKDAQVLQVGTIGMIEKATYDTEVGGFAEVEAGGAPLRVVLPPNLGAQPEKGDSVLLDFSKNVVLRLVKAEKPFSHASHDITWDDIGGLDEAKLSLREIVEFAFTHPELCRQYKKQAPKGLLFYGPPGCGKTLLGKALATAMARAHGTEDSGFIYTKAPEILNEYVGVSERNLRRIFAQGKTYYTETGVPPVLFFDEADAIFSRRGADHSTMVQRTIVPTFLTEVDGLEDTKSIVILATNRQDILDPAVVREGRIDRRIRVGRPNKAYSKAILRIYLKGVVEDVHEEQLAEHVAEEVFAESRVLGVYARGKTTLCLHHIVSGAMLATLVEQAKQFALRRDIANGTKIATGVTGRDLFDAVELIHKENRGLNHEYVLHELHEARKEAEV